jgi:hypothetical protein
MKINYLTVALALTMLAFAPQSSWALPVVTLDGNTATAIQGLPVNGVLYDVTFPLTDANSLYGPNPTFTFPFNESDASLAMSRITDLLGDTIATSVGMSSTFQSTSVFIGYEVSTTQSFSIDAQWGFYSNPSNRWLNNGTEFLTYDEERYFADFTPVVVPEPSSMMVTGCLLVGLAFRRRRLS